MCSDSLRTEFTSDFDVLSTFDTFGEDRSGFSHCREFMSCRGLTIGITVRNEENTLQAMIDSLILAVAQARLVIPSLDPEVIVCLNGCTDRSEEMLDAIVRRTGETISIRKICSQAGQIYAQRAIVSSRTKQGMIMFFDADIILDQGCVLELWNSLERDPSLYVAYAKGIAHFRGLKTLKHYVTSFGRRHREYRLARHYFHGRARELMESVS